MLCGCSVSCYYPVRQSLIISYHCLYPLALGFRVMTLSYRVNACKGFPLCYIRRYEIYACLIFDDCREVLPLHAFPVADAINYRLALCLNSFMMLIAVGTILGFGSAIFTPVIQSVALTTHSSFVQVPGPSWRHSKGIRAVALGSR